MSTEQALEMARLHLLNGSIWQCKDYDEYESTRDSLISNGWEKAFECGALISYCKEKNGTTYCFNLIV